MLNKVILIGRLTANIELRYSNDKIPYTYFTLAIQRQGSKDKTDFISCVAFRSTAELMARYLVKGSLISVEGRIEVYRTESSGEYQTRTNIVVNNIVFLDNKKQNQSNQINNSTSNFVSEVNDNTSFYNQSDISDSEEEFDFENFELKI